MLFSNTFYSFFEFHEKLCIEKFLKLQNTLMLYFDQWWDYNGGDSMDILYGDILRQI